MYNCSVVTVLGSTFENNHAQSVFTDRPSRVSGGGLSVTIYGNNSSSVTQRRFSYTIQNCTFLNNNANSTVPSVGLTSILQGGYINDRGGGVAFYVVHPLVVEINILNCNYTNNSANAFGGGVLVISPELVTEEDFTIADNHFERNMARSGGGGISLGAVFQQKDSKEFLLKSFLNESVIIRRNTFVQNTANGHGGAMMLGPGERAVSHDAHCLRGLAV